LLAQARADGLGRLDAQVLLAHVLGQSKTWLIAHDKDWVPVAKAAEYVAMCHRRQAGEPVAYLTGHREFFGIDLSISAEVLDPRPDTEILVEWALACLNDLSPSAHPAPRVADLGTGSGAVALALAQAFPHARVVGVERSAAALAVAADNARRLGLAVQWRAGDWCQPLERAAYALLVSNPPYLAEDDPHLPALWAEPLSALVAGPDGLADLRSIIQQAPAHLVNDGWLLLEHGFNQSEAVAGLLSQAGFVEVTHRVDLAGHTRCTGGRWLNAELA
jgi:release factor glutamine methyltransferase